MKPQTWIKTTVLLFVMLLTFFSVLMYICDPLLFFRNGENMFSSLRYNQLYSAPGVARHTNYDMVVTGSCMVGQFDVNEVNELFDSNAAKFTFNAATEKNIKTILDICFEANPSVDTVLISIDSFGAIKNENETGYPLPEYLYSISPSSYPEYLLNLDIVYHYITYEIIGTIKGKKEGPAEVLPDHLEGDYSAETVLSFRDENELKQLEKSDTSQYVTNTLLNLQNNLIPIIEDHPETEFLLFLPPYSVLYWEKQLALGTFQPMMESIKEVLGQCLGYKNVSVYSFMWDKENILNLDNYRDIMHYSADVASDMLVRITNRENQLTIDNYEEEIDGFVAFVNEFNYSSFVEAYKKVI